MPGESASIDQQTPEQHRARYEALRAGARSRATAAVPDRDPPASPARALRVAEETIAGGWYWIGRIARGRTLRLLNPTGRATLSLLLWNADDPSERFNAGDTMKLQWTSRLTRGHVLFSDMGKVMASIVADSCGRHDAIVGPSTAASNAKRYGLDWPVRSSRENLVLAAAKLGLGVADVPPCIAFFAPVETDETGRFRWQAGGVRPGDAVDLRAEMDLLCAVSNCPHPIDPARDYDPPEAAILVWRSPPAAEDDLCRTRTEEAVRGFVNTDSPFAGTSA